MYKVKHKETGTVRKVYGWNGLLFLVWREEINSWAYEPMSDYMPVEG